MSEGIEKGTFFLVAASGFSFVANYLIYIILGRFLLGPELLGSYAVVISTVSVIEMVLVKAVQYAVSKFVSESPESMQNVRKNALKLIIALDVVMFAAYLAGSDLIASAFGDMALVPYIRLASLLFLLHPVFSVFMGCLNGLHRFVTQAKLRALYAFAKLALIVGLVYAGFGLFGAISGFVIASFAGLAIGFFLTRGKAGQNQAFFDKGRFLLFMAPLVVFSLIADLLINIDLFAVKALSGSNGSLLAGYYVAAATIARIFPMVVSAIAFAIFPLVSAATFRQNLAKTRFYIENTVRYSLLVIAPTAALFVSTPKELISLVYSTQYLPGSGALQILSIAFAAYTFFLILSAVIAGSNRPKAAAGMALAALLLSVGLNILLVPSLSINGAAIATLAGSVLGLVLSAGFVFLKFRVLIPGRSFLKIALASLLIYSVSISWPIAGLALILKYGALLLAYAGVLFLLGELSKRDWAVLVNVVR